MNWKEVLSAYPENEETLQLYEEWGDSEYLKELFEVLSDWNPDWNKEKELGSWAAEFLLDLLEETEEESGEISSEMRKARFREMLEERYEDFRNGHQFVRVNNMALRADSEERTVEDIRAALAEEGERNGFPVLL